jgi:hypothetical protein
VTSNGRGGRRYAPYAFTGQGVAMLSSVLGSSRAIAIHSRSAHLRAGARLGCHTSDLAKRLSELEETTERLFHAARHLQAANTRAQLKQVFDALRELMTPPEPPKRPIGFLTPEERKKENPPERSGRPSS